MEHANRFCLSLHAGYGCRHSGACCTAGWTIPIESPAFERVRLHLGEQKTALHFTRVGALPEGTAAIVGVREDGACAFFESDRGRLCAIHRELGPDALPSACRQFPRVVVHDPRGMRISLSHFCPSAAALLMAPAPASIVAAPPNVDLGGALEGLDALEALPPLLRPEMLMDFESYWAWEWQAIDVLERRGSSAAQAIATIAAATRDLATWRPGPTTLVDAVARAFERPDAIAEDDDYDGDRRRAEWARASVPPALVRSTAAHEISPESHAAASRILEEHDRIVRHYLAARLFGNWIAYYGRGLRTVVEYLRICRAVLKMEVARHSACSPVSAPWQSVIEPAVRNSDLLLVHLSDTKELVKRLPPSRR
jgi:Fe-S-cluster containining protein